VAFFFPKLKNHFAEFLSKEQSEGRRFSPPITGAGLGKENSKLEVKRFSLGDGRRVLKGCLFPSPEPFWPISLP